MYMQKYLALVTGWIDSHNGSRDWGAELAQLGKHMILLVKQGVAKMGLSRSTIYNRDKDGSPPEPTNPGGNSVGWFVSDIDDFLERCVQVSRGGQSCIR
jgi:predicted DNA-binding transcriptional regulator AlpA